MAPERSARRTERRLTMLKPKWTPWILLAGVILSTGCTKAASDATVYTVLPDHHYYSPAFQTRAADELKALPAPCDRVEPVPPCSAVGRLVIDFGDVRQQIRAATQ